MLLNILAAEAQTPVVCCVPIAQDPCDLVFGLVTTPVLPVELHVVREHHVALGDLALDLRIIGESHWMTVRHADGSVLHEVLACAALPSAACAVHHGFADMRPFDYERGAYAASVAFEPLARHHATIGTAHDHIEVVFPGTVGDGASPVTRVWWHVAADAVRWWTLHVYADATAPVAVLTASRCARGAVAQHDGSASRAVDPVSCQRSALGWIR